ncbi:MAG: hypothetical protein HY806_08845, partial [Nitrospirae bacterium]|nr:hypothetical protein [Nitrospirota bacterium]
MIRVALIFIFIVTMVACEPRIDEMISDSQLIGGVPDISINIKEDNYKGGTAIIASGGIPFDVKREQLRPSMLSVLKVVLKKYPQSTGIFVRLTPNEELAKYGYFAGMLDYEEGSAIIHYKIPSDKQIKEWNSEIGKPIYFEGDSLGINDSPLLSRIDNKDKFETIKRVAILYHKFHKRFAD